MEVMLNPASRFYLQVVNDNGSIYKLLMTIYEKHKQLYTNVWVSINASTQASKNASYQRTRYRIIQANRNKPIANVYSELVLGILLYIQQFISIFKSKNFLN